MSSTPSGPRLKLVGRAGCHLCDDAYSTVHRVAAEFGLPVEHLDLDSRPELGELYAELIPVVLIDGRRHQHWRIDAEQLRTALCAATGGARPIRRRSWWRRRAR